jgi:toxin YoeB
MARLVAILLRVHEAVLRSRFEEYPCHNVETERCPALQVSDVLEAFRRDPFRGRGKPELIMYLGAGVWSHRLTQDHPLVYLVSADRIDVSQARKHY